MLLAKIETERDAACSSFDFAQDEPSRDARTESQDPMSIFPEKRKQQDTVPQRTLGSSQRLPDVTSWIPANDGGERLRELINPIALTSSHAA